MHYFPESLIKRFEILMTSEPVLEHVFNMTLDSVNLGQYKIEIKGWTTVIGWAKVKG